MLLAEMPSGENQDPHLRVCPKPYFVLLENQGTIMGNVKAFNHAFRLR